MVKTLQTQFQMQRSEILDKAQTGQLRKDMAAATSRTKANQRKRDWLALLLAWSAYNDSMRKALAPILYALMVEAGGQAMQQIGMDPSQFNPTDLAVLNYSQYQAQKIAEEINAETEKQLRASLGQGIDAGENDDQLRARVETVMGAALTYRAARIAVTETTRAQGHADVAAWTQAGTVTGKEWYTAEDEKVCAFCASLDGVIIPINNNFYSEGDVITASGQSMKVSYGDMPTPPCHVGCRCYLLPVLIA